MNPSKVKSPSRKELASLITHIGGAARLSIIILEFYERMSQDLMIGFFFSNKDLSLIASHQANFILNAAGLIPQFEGKGPTSAHLALPPILSGHFDRRLVILRETLVAVGLTQEQISKWVQFEESFRAIVVSNE